MSFRFEESSKKWMLAARQTCLLAVTLLAASPLAGWQDKPSEQAKSSKTQKAAKDADLPAILWRDPGEISSLDLTTGPGGKEHAPAANDDYKFIKEDLNATSTKFYVEDSHGVRWLVKVAEEAKPETAAAVRCGPWDISRTKIITCSKFTFPACARSAAAPMRSHRTEP